MTGTGNLERFLVKVKKGFEIKIDRLILTRIQNRIPNTKYNFLQAYAGQAKESNTATGENDWPSDEHKVKRRPSDQSYSNS